MWIRNERGALLNLDHMRSVFVREMDDEHGAEFYEVTARATDECYWAIAEFDTKMEADLHLQYIESWIDDHGEMVEV